MPWMDCQASINLQHTALISRRPSSVWVLETNTDCGQTYFFPPFPSPFLISQLFVLSRQVAYDLLQPSRASKVALIKQRLFNVPSQNNWPALLATFLTLTAPLCHMTCFNRQKWFYLSWWSHAVRQRKEIGKLKQGWNYLTSAYLTSAGRPYIIIIKKDNKTIKSLFFSLLRGSFSTTVSFNLISNISVAKILNKCVVSRIIEFIY